MLEILKYFFISKRYFQDSGPTTKTPSQDVRALHGNQVETNALKKVDGVESGQGHSGPLKNFEVLFKQQVYFYIFKFILEPKI